MKSSLTPESGIYDPLKRFAFTNITVEPFTFTWDKIPLTVKPNETIELPHHLAAIATKNLVDKIMIESIKIEESQMQLERKDPYFRHPKASSLGVPGARKIWEDKIVRQLAIDEESPAVAVMRMKLKAELEADLKAGSETAKSISSMNPSVSEFAGVGKK